MSALQIPSGIFAALPKAFDAYLNNLPMSSIEDFKMVALALQALKNGKPFQRPTKELPYQLQEPFKQMKQMLEVNGEAAKAILIARLELKIKEFSEMSNEAKSTYIQAQRSHGTKSRTPADLNNLTGTAL